MFRIGCSNFSWLLVGGRRLSSFSQPVTALRMVPTQQAAFLHLSGSRKVRVSNSGSPKSSSENERKSESAESGGSSSEEKSDGGAAQHEYVFKIDKNPLRKMRLFALIVGGTAFIGTYLLLSRPSHGSNFDIDPRTTPLEMDEFLNTYLPTGEVKRIAFFPYQQRAVAWLHDGAVINGSLAKHSVVAIKYPLRDGRPMDHFRSEIRAKEKALGIPIGSGVIIDEFTGSPLTRLVMLLSGVFILVYLGRLYSRAILQRMASMKNSQKGNKP